jgi:hypothetical protein
VKKLLSNIQGAVIMEIEKIMLLAETWDEKTGDILELKEIAIGEFELLLNRTYEILYKYHKEKVIPKEICNLILKEEEFMQFFCILGDKEEKLKKSFEVYRALHNVIEAMKNGFFSGEYNTVYPFLSVDMDNAIYEIDMSKAFIDELMKA